MSNIYVLGLCLSCIKLKHVRYVDRNICLLLQDMYGAIVLETTEMLRPQMKYV
jgi:3-oxoacyl-[acyl-carrier-protein] synthase III